MNNDAQDKANSEAEKSVPAANSPTIKHPMPLSAGLKPVTPMNLQMVGNSPDEILEVLNKCTQDIMRITRKNLIVFYSGWLDGKDFLSCNMSDNDLRDFADTLSGFSDKTVGVDVVIHSNGGDIDTALALGNLLREEFSNDVRYIVPHIAMSAATMLTFSGREIMMGQHSFLGPTDEFVNGHMASIIADESSKLNIPVDKQSIAQAAFITMIHQNPSLVPRSLLAIRRSDNVLRNWLSTGMFLDMSEEDKGTKITNILQYFSNCYETKSHNKHIGPVECYAAGLKIKNMESDKLLHNNILLLSNCCRKLFPHTHRGTIIDGWQFSKDMIL